VLAVLGLPALDGAAKKMRVPIYELADGEWEPLS